MIIPFVYLNCIMGSKCLFTVQLKTKKISNSNSDSQNLKQNTCLPHIKCLFISIGSVKRIFTIVSGGPTPPDRP